MDSSPIETKRKAALYAFYFRKYLSIADDMAIAFGELYANSLHLPHAREVALCIENSLKDYTAGYEEGYQEAIKVERLAHLNTLQRLIAHRYQVSQGYGNLQLEKMDINAIRRLIDVAFDVKTLAEFEKFVRQQVILSEITEDHMRIEVEKVLNGFIANSQPVNSQ